MRVEVKNSQVSSPYTVAESRDADMEPKVAVCGNFVRKYRAGCSVSRINLLEHTLHFSSIIRVVPKYCLPYSLSSGTTTKGFLRYRNFKLKWNRL